MSTACGSSVWTGSDEQKVANSCPCQTNLLSVSRALCLLSERKELSLSMDSLNWAERRASDGFGGLVDKYYTWDRLALLEATFLLMIVYFNIFTLEIFFENVQPNSGLVWHFSYRLVFFGSLSCHIIQAKVELTKVSLPYNKSLSKKTWGIDVNHALTSMLPSFSFYVTTKFYWTSCYFSESKIRAQPNFKQESFKSKQLRLITQ